MGSNASKSNAETAGLTLKNDSDKDISSNSDPRSPTPEITRTPLQVKNGGKHNITKNVDLRKKFESEKADGKLRHNNPILSAVIKNHLQSYDPRSPTQDFERTPIIVSKIDENKDSKKLLRMNTDNNKCASPCLNNDIVGNNCDDSFDINEISRPDLVVPKNLCNGFYDLTLNDTLKDNEEPLGSSTASNEIIQNDISEACEKQQFLETNFDYVENELDKFEDSEDNTDQQIDEINQIKETLDYDLKNVALYKILNEDPRSPSTGIERTPIVVSKVEDVSNENVEEMSDDSLIKVLQTNIELDEELDKNSDGILIYEDQVNAHHDTPQKPRSESNSGSRTPLSCMKNKTDSGHGRSKSSNKIYDTKNQKSSRPQKRVSHIPRLKSLTQHSKLISSESTLSLKNISKAISGDCENTPPHSHRDKWDKDTSIVL